MLLLLFFFVYLHCYIKCTSVLHWSKLRDYTIKFLPACPGTCDPVRRQLHSFSPRAIADALVQLISKSHYRVCCYIY